MSWGQQIRKMKAVAKVAKAAKQELGALSAANKTGESKYGDKSARVKELLEDSGVVGVYFRQWLELAGDDPYNPGLGSLEKFIRQWSAMYIDFEGIKTALIAAKAAGLKSGRTGGGGNGPVTVNINPIQKASDGEVRNYMGRILGLNFDELRRRGLLS